MSWKARLMGIACSVLASLPSAFFVHFILNSTKKFQGSEIPFVVKEGKKHLLVLPQHQAMCSDLEEVCQSIATWNKSEDTFTIIRGPQAIKKYQVPE